jgi:hypothetical protein
MSSCSSISFPHPAFVTQRDFLAKVSTVLLFLDSVLAIMAELIAPAAFPYSNLCIKNPIGSLQQADGFFNFSPFFLDTCGKTRRRKVKLYKGDGRVDYGLIITWRLGQLNG